MTGRHHDRNSDSDRFSDTATTAMLRLALKVGTRPVDELIDRLSLPDGEAWLAATLHRQGIAGRADGGNLLLEGGASLDQLRSIKLQSRTMVKDSRSTDERLAGVAGYFLAVAAAWRWHGTLLTHRDRAEVADVLLDLATAVPPPYSTILAQAAMLNTTT